MKEKTHLIKRLKKYRVDIQYTARICFKAYDRMNDRKLNREKCVRWLMVFSIFLSVSVLSGLMNLLAGGERQ